MKSTKTNLKKIITKIQKTKIKRKKERKQNIVDYYYHHSAM
jgi:hypothetical protein